jgi:hypothetical protein
VRDLNKKWMAQFNAIENWNVHLDLIMFTCLTNLLCNWRRTVHPTNVFLQLTAFHVI